ncbi:MAG: hypothetical protein Q8R02_15080 [Hyphomonadaceae bacterium]|nr:hypothetical protein [Hyphomonadaceae bacterium]
MVRGLVAGVAASLLLGACATTTGSAPIGDSGGLIDRYDEAALRSIVQELGYSFVDSDVSGSGKPFMTVEAGDELSFRIMGESCEGEGDAKVCAGVQLSTQFGETGDADFDAVMAAANRTLRPAKLFRIDSGLAYERYLIMDGGVSRENLKTNISVFVEVLEAISGQLFG